MRLEDVVDLLAVGVGHLRSATEATLLALLRDADFAGRRAAVSARPPARRRHRHCRHRRCAALTPTATAIAAAAEAAAVAAAAVEALRLQLGRDAVRARGRASRPWRPLHADS